MRPPDGAIRRAGHNLLHHWQREIRQLQVEAFPSRSRKPQSTECRPTSKPVETDNLALALCVNTSKHAGSKALASSSCFRSSTEICPCKAQNKTLDNHYSGLLVFPGPSSDCIIHTKFCIKCGFFRRSEDGELQKTFSSGSSPRAMMLGAFAVPRSRWSATDYGIHS